MHRAVGAAMLVLVVALLGCGGRSSAEPVQHSTRSIPQGPVLWLRPAAGETAHPLLTRNASRLAVIHPAFLHLANLDRINADPGLHAAAAAAKAANPRALVVPAVLDDELAKDAQGAAMLRTMLLDHDGASPGRSMEEHVATLVRLTEPYDGVAVDYEFSFDSLRGDAGAVRDGFSVFVEALRRALPRDKVLAVAVRARTGAAPASPAQAVYDLPRLGRAADLVEVSAYDHAWPTSEPGQIAPQTWVTSVARYARRAMQGTGTRPVLLIGNYGYDWPVDAGGRRTGTGKAVSATALRALPGFSAHATAWTYRRAGRTHRVYQITAAAMRGEIRRIARPLGLGVGFWSASEADPAAWSKIATALDGG